MLTIKTPYQYINEPGATLHAGQYIDDLKIGRHPLIIAGKSAAQALGSGFFSSLVKHGIHQAANETFYGYPSQRQFDFYASKAKENGADFIIGIGGGRVLDTAKATADILGLPVVTVPTVAATCAAWAAVTIQYDDKGSYVRSRFNAKAPYLVIADPKIIFTAPERYLFSGVVDTFAKFYEVRPTYEQHPDDVPLALALEASKIAFRNLEVNTFNAVKEAHKGIFGQAARDVIDAIIYLAGFAGSFKGDHAHYSFAHPFYHSSTRLIHTNIKLHGEKVAFGIITQLILEKKSDYEIKEALRIFNKYGAAFTLSDFALEKNQDEDLTFLKKDITHEFPYVPYTAGEIKSALLKADTITKDFLAEEKK